MTMKTLLIAIFAFGAANSAWSNPCERQLPTSEQMIVDAHYKIAEDGSMISCQGSPVMLECQKSHGLRAVARVVESLRCQERALNYCFELCAEETDFSPATCEQICRND
jgi:hypothetical protein